MHICLLGDSIFDNGSYTQGGPDVVAQLRPLLSSSDRATLLAVDGATSDDVHSQLERLPRDATHLVLSAGGNDALQAAGVLMQPVSSVGEGVYLVSQAAQSFEKRYARLLDALESKGLPLVICTIYNPRFSDPFQQAVCVAALCLWNDAIVRGALARGLPILDLRAVCARHDDYANDIEPSSKGALKIARGIKRVLDEHDFSAKRATIYSVP